MTLHLESAMTSTDTDYRPSVEAADPAQPASFSTRSSKRKRASAAKIPIQHAASLTPPPSNDPSDDDNFNQPAKEPLHVLAAASVASALQNATPREATPSAPTSPALQTALHVLHTEAQALAHIHTLYATSAPAQRSLARAIALIARAHTTGGRLVLCGVGKSGLVAQKTVATLKSLGVPAAFLHAAEAMHGDLGDLRAADALCFVSCSGATPELLALLPHVAPGVPVLAVSAHGDAAACALLRVRAAVGEVVLLPATMPEAEEVSFGVRAPTTSTAVALAVGDMLALAAAQQIHGGRDGVRAVFDRNHPGGAIGAATERLVAREIGGDEAEKRQRR